VRAAVETTAIRTGPGIMYAALSAAGTFGVLMLTDFRGIVEFGFIGGVAIFMAFIAMVTLFPAVLVVLDTRAGAPGGSRPSATALTSRPDVRVLDRLTAHSRTILGVAAVLTALSLWALPMVHFDYNRLNLQAKATESSAWERKIVAAGRSAFPALSSAESLEELRLKRDAFGRLSSVSDVVSVLNVIPEQQAEKIALVRDIAAVVAPVQVSAGGDEDPVRLRAALTTLRRRLELVVHEAGTDASPALRSAAERSQTLLHRLQDVRPNTARRLREIQGELRDDLGTQLRRLQDNLAPQPLTVADLPRELKRKFIGESGAFLVQVYPSVDTWDRSGVAQFVAELRSVDPSVTGSPVISYEAGQMVERAYFEGSLYAIVLIGVLSAVMLRRWSSATLAILPMVASTLWTIGVMRLLGLSFNLANVWALPLIIGASAEYGLNVALRHQEAVVDGGPVLPRSTVMAVLLNGLTTIAGFSSLMIARHQGIFGLGLLLTVGSVAGLTASLIVLPVLLRRLNPVERVPTPGAGVRRTAMISLTVAGVLLVPPAAVGPAMAGEPTEQVRTAVTELYQILTRSPGAADSRQREAAAQVMDRLFDWRTMAQHSLRHHWEARTPAEREQFTRLFADIFRQAYLARISLVDAGKFRYLGDRIVGDRAIVDTRVTTKRGSDIAVVYVTAQDRGPQWRVEDVRVEGISLLDNYRTQFDAIITRSSYEAFVKRLQDRLKQPG